MLLYPKFLFAALLLRHSRTLCCITYSTRKSNVCRRLCHCFTAHWVNSYEVVFIYFVDSLQLSPNYIISVIFIFAVLITV